MLLSNNKRQFLSVRIQVIILVFSLLFVFSSVLLILFHSILTNNIAQSNLEIVSPNIGLNATADQKNTQKNIIDITQNIQRLENENFWKSFLWVLIANAFTDFALAYAVGVWVVDPIEGLYVALNNAYKQGIGYTNLNDKKFYEIEAISQVVALMTSKYINAIDEQNRFLQDISHELRTPLAAIKSSSDLIKLNNQPTIEEYKIFFENVELVNKRMIKLVNELTLLNKTEGELYDDTEVNISKLLTDTIQKQQEIASLKDIVIESKIEPHIKLKGSAKNLSLAFSNILNNSIKYSNNKSLVEVNLYIKKKKIFLIIKDNGIGISEADIQNIFEKFYRGENALEQEGFGLNLQISKKIIASHSGKIFIKSKLGMGSEVKVIF